MRGQEIFRRVRAPLWNVEARLAELDAAGIAAQLVSPVPVTMTYWSQPSAAVAFTRGLNDALAADVRRSGGRLIGLGGLPLPDVDAAIDELRRLRTELGLAGVEIGSRIGEYELDDPHLRPFFSAAEALDAIIFVHPTDGGGGAIRRSGTPYDIGLGMLTDTAMAATALVFGGLLEQCPDLRIVLAHGCGTYPWAYPRLRMSAEMSGEADLELLDRLTRSLWVDSLVLDPENLPLLIERFGADHVMIGTDHPFIADQLTAAPAVVRAAAQRRRITDDQEQNILRGNATGLLDLALPDAASSIARDQVACDGLPPGP